MLEGAAIVPPPTPVPALISAIREREAAGLAAQDNPRRAMGFLELKQHWVATGAAERTAISQASQLFTLAAGAADAAMTQTQSLVRVALAGAGRARREQLLPLQPQPTRGRAAAGAGSAGPPTALQETAGAAL